MEYSGERFLPEICEGEIAIEHYQRYRFASQMTLGKLVLDAACGEGYGSSLIAQNAKKVIGLDIDKEAVNNANSKYGNDKLSFVEGSVETLPFENAYFDMVISYETIEHVNESVQKAFLTEIKRVLKPGGILIMSTPNKTVYTDSVSSHNQFHIKEFYIQEYVDFLHEQFAYVELFSQFPDTGYFILRDEQGASMSYPGQNIEKSRYVIAICSDEEVCYPKKNEDLIAFSDQMYYFLNRSVHELEEKLIDTKAEADVFQEQQEKSIVEQKAYIDRLEKDIRTQQEYIARLEKEMSSQKEYVIHLENDISAQKEYVTHLENDIATQMSCIAQRDKDIAEQADYIAHLERDIVELKDHIQK